MQIPLNGMELFLLFKLLFGDNRSLCFLRMASAVRFFAFCYVNQRKSKIIKNAQNIVLNFVNITKVRFLYVYGTFFYLLLITFGV